MHKDLLQAKPSPEYTGSRPQQSGQSHHGLSSDDVAHLARYLGKVAVASGSKTQTTDQAFTGYFRARYSLDDDGVRDLEGYLDFLRHHYGIEAGATVFPKREDVFPAQSTELPPPKEFS